MNITINEGKLRTDPVYRAALVRLLRATADDPQNLARLCVDSTMRQHFLVDAPASMLGLTALRLCEVVRTLRVREGRGSRYANPDRTHDLGEFAEAIAAMMRDLTWARKLSNEALAFRTDLGDRSDEEHALQEAMDCLAGALTCVVGLVASRWIPAVGCAVAHLPETQRTAATAAANRHINTFASLFDAWQFETHDIERERQLWMVGAGVLDAAAVAAGVMLEFLVQLAQRLEGDNPVNEFVRSRASEDARRFDEAWRSHHAAMVAGTALAFDVCEDLQPLRERLAASIRAAVPAEIDRFALWRAATPKPNDERGGLNQRPVQDPDL